MDSESIANFCSITDATDTTAEYFLNAAGGDLDIAIGLFYESESGGGGTGSNRNIHEISHISSARNADSSRAQLPQITTISSSSEGEGEGSVLIGESEEVEDVIFNSRSANSSATARRLADLFRPPHGIMFNGSLEMARKRARELNRWLLLTIHAPTDFASQAMNRDLWNSALLQSFIKDNFVFMQIIVGGGEEKRYSSFYPYDGLYPHVALIDPRTGERVETLLVASIPVPGFKLVPTDRDMLEILGDFLAQNPLDPLPSTSDESRKRSTSSPKLEIVEESAKKTLTESLVPKPTPQIIPQYEGTDSIQIQFRLPSGQKHRHRFNPRTLSISEIFRTAAAVSQIPLGEFKLRTAEEELGEEEDEAKLKGLNNTMITIIK